MPFHHNLYSICRLNQHLRDTLLYLSTEPLFLMDIAAPLDDHRKNRPLCTLIWPVLSSSSSTCPCRYKRSQMALYFSMHVWSWFQKEDINLQKVFLSPFGELRFRYSGPFGGVLLLFTRGRVFLMAQTSVQHFPSLVELVTWSQMFAVCVRWFWLNNLLCYFSEIYGFVPFRAVRNATLCNYS